MLTPLTCRFICILRSSIRGEGLGERELGRIKYLKYKHDPCNLLYMYYDLLLTAKKVTCNFRLYIEKGRTSVTPNLKH